MYHETSIFEDQPSTTIIDPETHNNSFNSSGPKLSTIIFIAVGVIIIGVTIYFLIEQNSAKTKDESKARN